MIFISICHCHCHCHCSLRAILGACISITISNNIGMRRRRSVSVEQCLSIRQHSKLNSSSIFWSLPCLLLQTHLIYCRRWLNCYTIYISLIFRSVIENNSFLFFSFLQYLCWAVTFRSPLGAGQLE